MDQIRREVWRDNVENVVAGLLSSRFLLSQQSTDVRDAISAFSSYNCNFVRVSLVTSPETKPCDVSARKNVRQKSDDDDLYKPSRSAKLNCLQEKIIFTLVDYSKAVSHRIYGSWFCDHIKHSGTPFAQAKPRLVIQALHNKLHCLVTHAPTVQKSSRSLLFATYRMFGDFTFIIRDVTQAYVQSQAIVQRSVLIKPPPMLTISQKHLLQVYRPLYGLSKAGLSCFKTYRDHFKNNLENSLQVTIRVYVTRKTALTTRWQQILAKVTSCLKSDDTRDTWI